MYSKDNNGNQTCKAVLDALIAPEAQWRYFSWSGRGPTLKAQNEKKLGFKTSCEKIIGFIYAIILKVQPLYSMSNFTTRISDLLKTAKSRTAAAKQISKVNRTKQTTPHSTHSNNTVGDPAATTPCYDESVPPAHDNDLIINPEETTHTLTNEQQENFQLI